MATQISFDPYGNVVGIGDFAESSKTVVLEAHRFFARRLHAEHVMGVVPLYCLAL